MVTATPPNDQTQPVIVSEQHERIIRACLRYQFMTVEDFCAVLGMPTSRTYLRRVLSRLAGKQDQTAGHFLYKFALAKTTAGAATRVFVPGDRSRELLEQWEDKDGMTWNYPAKMHNYSYSYVYHNLAVTRLAICAALFCREHQSYTLAELRLWHDMHRMPPRLNPEAEGGEGSPSVIPDLWLYLQADGRGAGLWFEVDNSTTFRQSFLRRLYARLSLFASEAYASYFGTQAVLCCYAVLGKSPQLQKARLENLRQWTQEFLVKEEREEWAAKFRFAAIEYESLYEQPERLFTASIWHGPGKLGKTTTQPLLSPLLPTEDTHGHYTSEHETHPNPS